MLYYFYAITFICLILLLETNSYVPHYFLVYSKHHLIGRRLTFFATLLNPSAFMWIRPITRLSIATALECYNCYRNRYG